MAQYSSDILNIHRLVVLIQAFRLCFLLSEDEEDKQENVGKCDV